MRTRLLAAGLLAAIAGLAVLALASFGGASTRPDNVLADKPVAFNVKKSKFALVANVDNGATSFTYNKGFASVTHPGTGTYCLAASKPAKFNPFTRPALVTVDWGQSIGSSLMAFIDYDAGCPANDYEILTYDTSGASTDNAAFVIAVG